jgi:stress-induced-phosphoprotein 1
LPPPPTCRNADTLKRLQETEKAVREAAQAAYIDLDISSQEKEKGNAAFKEQR